MEKFTLNEAFDKIYEAALEDQLQEDIHSLVEDTLYESESNQFLDSLKILQEAYMLEQDGDGIEGEEDKKRSQTYSADRQMNSFEDSMSKKILDLYDNMYKRAEDAITNKRMQSNDTSYAPIPQFQEITKITDMKFPKNIIFFITQFIKWIKNNILHFIERFSNIVRAVLGLNTAKEKLTEKDLKLNLNKAKTIETKYVIDGKDAYSKDVKSFYDVVNNKQGFSANVKPVTLTSIPFDDIKTYFNEDSTLNIFDGTTLNEDQYGYSSSDTREQKVIRLDTSRDLFALKQSLEHFFDLFDNAYGSNDEKLFSVDDLQLMLELFKNTIDEIKKPTAASYAPIEIGGSMSFGKDTIDPNRLHDNYLRTKINTDQLKAAYVVTNKQINNIAQIIMNKNLLGASQMGVQYAFLSASTYEVMIQMIQTINKRLKDAGELEKKLRKMKSAYENLTNQLDKFRGQLNSISGMTYTSIIQKRVNDIYDGARYMTATVQLRLNTLALFISELNDTRAILINLNAIPESAMKDQRRKLLNIRFDDIKNKILDDDDE